VSRCHAVLTTGLFGRRSCLGTHGTSLDLISKPAWLVPLTCCATNGQGQCLYKCTVSMTWHGSTSDKYLSNIPVGGNLA